MPGFGERLAAAISSRGNLCVGIDPQRTVLKAWGLDDTADGARELGLRVIEASAGRVPAVKPQVAFFERFGAAGFSALERVLAAARDAGLLVIADAKRGDIGSTLDGYGDAWLAPGSPLEADALTVNPFLGLGALRGAIDLAHNNGKGLFVLAATSNPEGFESQSALLGTGNRQGSSVAAGIVEDVRSINTDAREPVGSIGLVLGATADFPALGIDLDGIAGPPATPVLAPGFGHQGAQLADFHPIFGQAAATTLASVSRTVLGAGPHRIVAAIESASEELAA
jgi:orotidine-5'-phosphate decarboxylase